MGRLIKVRDTDGVSRWVEASDVVGAFEKPSENGTSDIKPQPHRCTLRSVIKRWWSKFK